MNLIIWITIVTALTFSEPQLALHEHKQSELIIYRTITIFNKKYLASADWKKIPIDQNSGEDINSKKYGGVYYPPKIRSSAQKENRTTVARNTMAIEVDLLNQTNQYWMLQRITLNVKAKHDLTSFEHAKGEWEVGSRSSGYHPYFGIDGIKTSVTDVPDDHVVAPEEEIEDSRIILEVEVTDMPADKRVIYEFDFTLTFRVKGGGDQQFELRSDKSYFIASE